MLNLSKALGEFGQTIEMQVHQVLYTSSTIESLKKRSLGPLLNLKNIYCASFCSLISLMSVHGPITTVEILNPSCVSEYLPDV